MSNTTNTLLHNVLNRAHRHGIEADVILSQEQQFGLKVDQGHISEYKVSSSRSVGIRVVKGDRVGTSYSESTTPEHLDTMVQNAIENADYAKDNPHEKITATKQIIPDWNKKTFQPDTATTEEKIALALSLEQNLQGRAISAKAPYNGFSEVEHEIHVANSLGHICSQRERALSCYTYALLETDGQQAMYLGYQVGRQFYHLNAESCVDTAYETAHALLGGAPVPTGSYNIVFTTDCLNELFAAFGMCWSGQAAMDGINPLRDRLDSQIASKDLSIIDKPDVAGGFALRPFDSEGFSTQQTPIITKGIFNGFLHNSATAGFFDVPNTANASRHTKSTLAVSPSHLCIDAGTQSETDCKSGTYLEIINLQGVHSGANAISGDFSLGASGFLCKNGERVQPVRGITVAGNFYQMLQAIEAIGDTIHADHGKSFFAPLIRFAKLSVAGA